ncbi:MAG TPA: class I SAM-dependent methyltransferase [Polyangiaceae bacterium]|nr:class I SAM-dependent methyltransferase [Polyangiaceae bacterium]
MADESNAREDPAGEQTPSALQPHAGIYEPQFVRALFDEMSASYELTNYVSSFGFSARWRRQAVADLTLRPGALVVDLMSGMGECWTALQRRMQGAAHIVAIDLSPEMCRHASRKRLRVPELSIEVRQGDALRSGLPDASADAVVACFGLKTFSPAQLDRLSAEVWRTLKPGGAFCFVEVAVPTGALLRTLYLFYLRFVIPLIGRLFLGNPQNYRLLSVYTECFARGATAKAAFERQGFRVTTTDLFFGCARRLLGHKPADARPGA